MQCNALIVSSFQEEFRSLSCLASLKVQFLTFNKKDLLFMPPGIRRKHHFAVLKDLYNMIRHVKCNRISLAVPLKLFNGLTKDLPDIEVVFPLETVNVALAESDEVSFLTVSAQTQQEVLPVLTAARALETGDQLLPDGGVHQLGLARGG